MYAQHAFLGHQLAKHIADGVGIHCIRHQFDQHQRAAPAKAALLRDMHHPTAGVGHPTEVGDRPLRLLGKGFAVGVGGEIGKAAGAVKRKVAPGRAGYRTIAPRTGEARNANALLHMLSVIPLVEICFMIWVDIAPDEKLCLIGCTDIAHSAS